MNGAFYIAATGLEAQQRALDTAANNIANLNTQGYKRAYVRFSELLTPAVGTESRPAIDGVSVDNSARVFDQGEVRATGEAMDLAIDGHGFIELLGKDGSALLWRGGALKINDDGYLAASNGVALAAMISVPADAEALNIAADGKVTASSGGQAGIELGQIDLVTPRDLAALKPAGEGFYQVDQDGLTAAAPGDLGTGVLRQGAMEASNVDLSQEMVGLLLTQRAYAANAQVLQAGDQLMSIANNLRR